MQQTDMTKQTLPPGWANATLGEVTAPRGLRIKPSEMQDAPFIGLEHIEAHTMRLLDMAKASEVKSSASYFGQGDVIFGRLRPYLNKVYMPDFSGLASGEFIVFPSQLNLDNAYLKYFLNQWEFVSFVTRLNTGDRPRVEFTQFADYPFPLAPFPEQHRIVAEIEKQFTRLDASVESLKRAQANLKRCRASVLKSACEGSLVPTEAELARADGRTYEPAGVLLERILAERRARWESQEKRRGKYKEPSAPDTSDLPNLLEGWGLTGVCKVISERCMARDLQVGLGLWPGFGQQPDAAPEAPLEQQAPEPVDAVAHYADGARRTAPRVAMIGSQCFGRRPQAAWGNPAVVGVFHPGAIGQGQQGGHRQHQPVAGNTRWVGAPGLIPLPAQALDGLEAQFDPEAQGVPTWSHLIGRKVGEDDPGFVLLDVPDDQQGAAALGFGSAEGGSAANPGRIGTGNEALGRQPAPTVGAESDAGRHTGIPTERGSASTASDWTMPRCTNTVMSGTAGDLSSSTVHPRAALGGAVDAPGHGKAPVKALMTMAVV